MLRSRSRWWWGMAVLLTLLSSGCASQPRPVTPPTADPVIVRATSVIDTANKVYSRVVIESSHAYFNDELDEATYLQIKAVAKRVNQSLHAAKAAVEVYNVVKSVDNAEGAESLFSALEIAYKELDSMWKEVSGGE